MGDIRFQRHYALVKGASDRVAQLQGMSEEDLVAALAGASEAHDPLLANILATETQNRVMRNRTILENLGEALVVETPLGFISAVNAETERLMGWPREELLGRDFHALCHVADQNQPGAPCPILRAAATGNVMYLHKEVFQTRKGRRFWSSVTVAPLKDDAGEVNGLICVFHDTTRERQQHADVERGRNLITAVHKAEDAMGQGSLVLEQDDVVYANDAFLRMSGYTFEELRAMPSYLDLFHASFTRDALRRLLQTESGLDVPTYDEGRLLHKSGAEVPVEVSIVKVKADDEDPMQPELARLVMIVRDVTRQKEAEAQLRRVVENLPEGVYVTDVQGRITFANVGAERILGLERSRIAGRTYHDNLWGASQPDGTPLLESQLPAARALRGEHVLAHPLSLLHAKTRERIHLRVSAAPLEDDAGRVVGSVVSFHP